MPDRVHQLASIQPKMSVSSFMGYLKGKSTLMMFDKHANLKYRYGKRHFWAEGVLCIHGKAQRGHDHDPKIHPGPGEA